MSYLQRRSKGQHCTTVTQPPGEGNRDANMPASQVKNPAALGVNRVAIPPGRNLSGGGSEIDRMELITTAKIARKTRP